MAIVFFKAVRVRYLQVHFFIALHNTKIRGKVKHFLVTNFKIEIEIEISQVKQNHMCLDLEVVSVAL